MPDEIKNVERRKGPDFWVKLIQWTGMTSWFILFGILLIIERAKPEFETMFDKMFDIQLENTWDFTLIRYAFYMMILLFVVSITTFLINFKRCRRKSDKYNISIIIMGLLSFVGVIVCSVLFYNY